MKAIDATTSWFPSIERAISAGEVKTFRTKKEAVEVAREYGWCDNVLRVNRRFERSWLVGKIDFQPEEICGIVKDILRVPLLKFVNGAQPVVKFSLVRK